MTSLIAKMSYIVHATWNESPIPKTWTNFWASPYVSKFKCCFHKVSYRVPASLNSRASSMDDTIFEITFMLPTHASWFKHFLKLSTVATQTYFDTLIVLVGSVVYDRLFQLLNINQNIGECELSPRKLGYKRKVSLK